MEAIVFPDGTQVPATPGKYRIVPPPNLNDLIEGRFLLEYDFPFLLVQDMSTRASSDEEQNEANRQAGNWRVHHPQIKAKVGGCRLGYQLNKPPSRRARGCHRQFIPDISYVDERTWCRLSPEEKNKGYLPCVPRVVIEIMSVNDKIEDLQGKVTKFINAGTREGVIVDTRHNRVWIYNRNQQPYFELLAPIEFESWPGFTLDCIAMRDARMRLQLP